MLYLLSYARTKFRYKYLHRLQQQLNNNYNNNNSNDIMYAPSITVTLCLNHTPVYTQPHLVHTHTHSQ